VAEGSQIVLRVNSFKLLESYATEKEREVKEGSRFELTLSTSGGLFS